VNVTSNLPKLVQKAGAVALVDVRMQVSVRLKFAFRRRYSDAGYYCWRGAAIATYIGDVLKIAESPCQAGRRVGLESTTSPLASSYRNLDA
jgi:hypothetical protein